MNAATLTIDDPALDHRILTPAEELSATPTELVLHNLKLAARVACSYARKLCPALDVEDAYQCSVTGLITAADKWEASRGYRFSTYATWWCRNAVGRFVRDHLRLVRVPVHAQDSLRRRSRTGDRSPLTECEEAAR